MINRAKFLFFFVLGGCLCGPGCHKENRVNASPALQQSFQSSEPEVKQAIATATTSLNAGDYTDAAKALNPVLTGRQLTPEQKHAAGLLFQQINQALTANPNLDSKELYELRVKLHQGVTGGSRF
jgi:hypothetical protein